ncbi:UNVERIFIED_CONTAM: hypothetical protein FKN15_055605, partial [Acipenser sinensis]
ELWDLNRTSVFYGPRGFLDLRTMFLDEYQECLFVGGRDLMYSLNLDRVNEEYREIHWPSTHTQLEECRMEGKDVAECANFIRVFHQYNRTHHLACGTGAFDPVCAYIRVGHWTENDLGGQRMLVNKWTTLLKTRLICSVPGPNGIDTHFDELEPKFVGSYVIPDNDDHEDDKVYFFFTEKAIEVDGGVVYTRVGRVCAVKTDERIVKTDHGLLFLKVHRMDGGTYFCQTVEHGFIHTVTKITLEVLEEERIEEMFNKDDEEELHHTEPCPAPQGLSHGSSRLWYKEFLQLIGYSNFQRVEEYCMRVWSTDKKRKKLKTPPTKWKYSQVQERQTKTRGERHRSPRHARDT